MYAVANYGQPMASFKTIFIINFNIVNVSTTLNFQPFPPFVGHSQVIVEPQMLQTDLVDTSGLFKD